MPTPRANCASALRAMPRGCMTIAPDVVVSPMSWGPARIDAITVIVNRDDGRLQPDIPENWSTPIAPTKPPFLWNSAQGSWTQWRGKQQDPITRNLSETMGVFMPMDLRSKTPEEGLFDSNAAILNLQKIEDALWHLAPPKWPEDVLGKIDREKALQGKALFITHCASCHNAWPYTWTEPNKYGKRFIEVGLVPQKYVGTESGSSSNLEAVRDHRSAEPLFAATVPGQGDRTDGRSQRHCIGTQVIGQGAGTSQTDRSGDRRSAWLSRIPAAASTSGRVQGSAARRSVGHAAIPA